eukprot:gene16747-19096_t
MLPDDKIAIDTIFEASKRGRTTAQFSQHIAEPLLTSGYDKYQLVASVGPDMATRLCFLDSIRILSVQHQAIASSINDETIASNLLLLDFIPPSTSEYLLAGHLQTYLRLLGDNNYGLLKRSFVTSLNTLPSGGKTLSVIKRALLIQLMATRRECVVSTSNNPDQSLSTVPGQLVAAALQRVIELHGLSAGTQLLETVCESVDLLPAESISSLAYSVMLNTILYNNNEASSLSHRKKELQESDLQPTQHAALLALLRLSKGNAAAAVELRAVLLKTLMQYHLHHTAASLASLCVQEYRWLGTDTINSLAHSTTDMVNSDGTHFPLSLLRSEQANLTHLLSQAEAIYSQYDKETLILPASVARVKLAGQEFASFENSDQMSSVNFDSRLLLQVSPDGTLDLDALLPPPNLTVGLTVNTISAQLSVIEQDHQRNPTAQLEFTIRRLLETLSALQATLNSDQNNENASIFAGCSGAAMDILLRVAKMSKTCNSILVVNKVVEMATQLGQLSDRQQDDCKYTWQLSPQLAPPAATSAALSSVLSVLNTSFTFPGSEESKEADPVVTPLLCWEEQYGSDLHSTSSSGAGAASVLNKSADENVHRGEEDASLALHPSLVDMQLLLQAQFATIRHINSLSLMQKAFGHAARCAISLNVNMAHDAVNVFLFWKVHSNVRAIFASLEQTQGPRRALHMSQELLLSLVSQDRLLDAAKVTLEVVRLQRAADKQDPPKINTATKGRDNAPYSTLQSLLRHLVLQSEGNAEGIDQGRHALDMPSATDAIAAIVLNSLHQFDALVGSTNDLRVVKAAQKDKIFLREVVLLLKWFRHQHPRHPEQTAQVYEAVRAAVISHSRGPELLQLLDATLAESKKHSQNEATKEGLFPAASLGSSLKVKSDGSIFRFDAYTYDDLEMRDNDSERENEYLKVTRK